MSKEKIQCSFSLLDTGRTYTGQHRKYLIENAREICYAPETREIIRLREAFGYYGHGRRVLAGRQDLTVGEVSIITMPNGQQAMVSNVPSNITVAFDVSQDGQVSHTQELLDTETGKIVAGLHASRVGGFSWACQGKDGRQSRPSILSGFSGFDYVLQPGFSGNRGYVLESAVPAGDRILESVAAVVGNDARAEQLVAGWRLDAQNRQKELENAIFESESRIVEVTSERDAMAEKLKQTEEAMTNVRRVIENIADSLPFFIPEAVMHEMLEGDFQRARGIFESARRFDFSQFPVSEKKENGEGVNIHVLPRDEKPDYGTSDYGFTLEL